MFLNLFERAAKALENGTEFELTEQDHRILDLLDRARLARPYKVWYWRDGKRRVVETEKCLDRAVAHAISLAARYEHDYFVDKGGASVTTHFFVDGRREDVRHGPLLFHAEAFSHPAVLAERAATTSEIQERVVFDAEGKFSFEATCEDHYVGLNDAVCGRCGKP